MKHTLTISACILALCGFAACNGTPEKTAGNKTDSTTRPKPPAHIFSMMADAGKGGSPNPPLAVAPITFGIKAADALECMAGAGICESPSVVRDPSNSNDTMQIFANTFTIRINKANLQQRSPVFYDSLNKYGMNGIISFEDNYAVDSTICRRLGNTTGITLRNGSPIVFQNMSDGDAGQVALSFYGAIPGNSSNIIFSNCAGTAYTCDISFSPLTANGGCPGYTYFYNNTNGSGSLIIYMQTQNVISQQGISDCIPVDTNWSMGYSMDVFSPASQYVFSDSTIAASMSVPLGWIIPSWQRGGNNYIYFNPNGWCTLQLFLQQPQSGAQAK